jgi:hypothetical protein
LFHAGSCSFSRRVMIFTETSVHLQVP